MRKILLVFLLLAIAVGIPARASAADTSNFTIQSFSADYYLTRDAAKASQLEVKETIVAVFPGFDQNHGILRAIPEEYKGHTVSLQVKSVTDQTGKAYSYNSSSSNGNQVLKIGDADKYVHGVTTYVINYTLHNVISLQAESENAQTQDEFYWDVNGDQWPQAIGTVTARLHIPMDLANSITGDSACYAGHAGSQGQACTQSQSQGNDEVLITTTATGLSGYQNLTTVVGFTKGTFQQGPEVAREERNRTLLLVGAILLTLVLPLVTFIICFRKWWRQGRDPKGRGVAIPEYIAPKSLNAVSSAYILHMSLPSKAVSAGIIEMAVHGYLRINEIEKKRFLGKSIDYEIEVIKEPASLTPEQHKILDALFDGPVLPGSRTAIGEQKNKLYSTLQKLNEELGTSLTSAGYFSSDPRKAKTRFVGAGIAMLVVGFILLFLLPLGVGLVLAALIALIFSAVMPARSQKGVETRDYLLGLKEYIQMAEADRIQYLQSPQGAEKRHIDPNSPKQQLKLFEDLLPYAILFGLEKDWAEQFKDLYKQPPSWYGGNMATFNTVYLASSIGKFSSASATAFTAPSSSSSSGLGGGGFSGGGGGGGGGGGW